jgi:hypothetical protein
VPSVRGEFVDATIAITVRDIEIPRTARHRHMCRPIERLTLPFGSWLIGAPEGHEQFALQGEFLDGVKAVVHEVDGLIRTDMHAVRSVAKLSLAERAQEVAVAVEHTNRVLAAVENVYVVVSVYGDARYIDEFPAWGQFFPIFHGFEEQVSATDCRCHNALPPFETP